MQSKWIIDAVVRQTTVLIAHLATAAGIRAPLAHIANQIFLELVRELESQGVGRKVVADMFGLALRSYQLKVQRLSESASDSNQSLWEAVLGFIRDHEDAVVLRADILQRFRLDDQRVVGGILNDLVDNGFVFKMGRGARTTYRAATEEELDTHRSDPEAAAAALAWVQVYHSGPATRDELQGELGMEAELLQNALDQLVEDGRIEAHETGRGTTYQTRAYLLPMGEPDGWAAAVFDHYQAMVVALCAKLSINETTALPGDLIGGSTYAYDITHDHPYATRVLGLLKSYRDELSELMQEVDAYNAEHPSSDGDDPIRVVFYIGQNTMTHDASALEESS